MKIAHIYQSISTDFSQPQAAQLHIYHTIRVLQTTGHQVFLLAPRRRGVLFSDDLGVFINSGRTEASMAQLGISGSKVYQLFESGFRRLQREFNLPYLGIFDSFRVFDACLQMLPGWDLIHERYNLLAIGGALASRRLGIPFILEVNADLLAQREFRGHPEKGLRKLFARWATRFCFDTAARIICISEELADHLRHSWNIPEQKLKVLPCAADVDSFKPNPPSPELRHKFQITEEPVLMWIGGFYEWHDLNLLIESFILVLEHCSNAKLILVGDGNTRPAIEQKIVENDLHDRVLLTGAIPHHKVPEMLSLADIVVSPAPVLKPEAGGTGTPLKLFEYMASGKSIIATATSQTEAILRHGENGLLVPDNQAFAFAEAILKLIHDPSLRCRLGHAARLDAEKYYNWEEYSHQLEAIYLDVI